MNEVQDEVVRQQMNAGKKAVGFLEGLINNFIRRPRKNNSTSQVMPAGKADGTGKKNESQPEPVTTQFVINSDNPTTSDIDRYILEWLERNTVTTKLTIDSDSLTTSDISQSMSNWHDRNAVPVTEELVIDSDNLTTSDISQGMEGLLSKDSASLLEPMAAYPDNNVTEINIPPGTDAITTPSAEAHDGNSTILSHESKRSDSEKALPKPELSDASAQIKAQPSPDKAKNTMRERRREGTPIKGNSIKPFDKIARKHGVEYSIESDFSKTPAQHNILFKAPSKEAMTAAFKEFTSQEAKRSKSRKEPHDKKLAEAKGQVKSQVPDQTKNIRREGHNNR